MNTVLRFLGVRKSMRLEAAYGVLSGAAVERISKSVMDKVVITDTISPRPDVLAEKRIKVVSVAELIAQAIQRTHREESISSLFD